MVEVWQILVFVSELYKLGLESCVIFKHFLCPEWSLWIAGHLMKFNIDILEMWRRYSVLKFVWRRKNSSLVFTGKAKIRKAGGILWKSKSCISWNALKYLQRWQTDYSYFRCINGGWRTNLWKDLFHLTALLFWFNFHQFVLLCWGLTQ